MRLPRPDVADRLAQRLNALDYTVEGVQSLLGPVASAALERGSTVLAGRQLRDDPSPLSTLVRVFLLAELVEVSHFDAALAESGELGDLVSADGGDRVCSALEVAPYATDGDDWLLASDWPTVRTGRPVSSQHVLGAGGASQMLAQCTVRPTVRRALDLGTGCGVQALHLSQHSESVVATDVSSRCLDLASFNAQLNRASLDVWHGSLFEPVRHERFDLIVSNPPFVIGSPDAGRHDYRDSGLPGDEVCARIVGQAEGHLSDGGWCQLLANWEVHAGEDWFRAPQRWLGSSGLDAWVVQREVQDPAEYVETWLRDAGDDGCNDYERRYRDWYSGLAARDVVGVGFGLVSLRAGGHDEPIRRFQHAAQPLAQPVGVEIARWFDRQDYLRTTPGAEVLAARLSVAPDVRVDVRLRPGAERPEELLALRETGWCWTATLDAFAVDLLDRMAADRPVGEVVAEVAQAADLDVEEALTAAVPVLRRMIEEGFLESVA